ncbi:MAG: hypothetical protein R2751_09685 [Bacteroidales bacterium]
MKKFLPLIGLLMVLFANNLNGQGSWLSAYGIVGQDTLAVRDMVIADNGDAYIIGTFQGNILSTAGSVTAVQTNPPADDYDDIFLLKVLSNGTHAWLKRFGHGTIDLPGELAIGPDNSLYVTGNVNAFYAAGSTIDFDGTPLTTSAADAFLANYDPDGTLNWVRIVAGGAAAQRIDAMRIDGDRIVVAGFARNSVTYDLTTVLRTGTFTHLAVLDLDGNLISQNTIGFKGVFPNLGTGLVRSIAITPDGYGFAGEYRDSLFLDVDSLYCSYSDPDHTDIFLYKTNKDLEGQWVRRTNSAITGENIAHVVRFDGVDNLYMAGKMEPGSEHRFHSHRIRRVVRFTGGDQGFVRRTIKTPQATWTGMPSMDPIKEGCLLRFARSTHQNHHGRVFFKVPSILGTTPFPWLREPARWPCPV